MSRIEDLIAKYCPNGVEYLCISDLSDFVSGLKGKTKEDFGSGNAKYVSYKNVFDNIEVDFSNLESVKINDGERQTKLRRGDLIFTSSSENLEESGMTSVVTKDLKEDVFLNSFCFFVHLPKSVKPEFAKYLFRSAGMRKQIIKCANGVTRYNISKKALAKIKFPVPPLEVQDEIVRILDSFTKLEAELEAELEARRKQYEYYRDSLLSFENLNNRLGGVVSLISLRDVSGYSVEKISASLTDNNSFVGVDNLIANKRGKKPSGYAPNTNKLSKFYPGDILIGNIRPYLRKIWQSSLTGGASGDVLVISIKDERQKEISSRFLYHVLASEDFFEYDNRFSKGAKMPRGDKKAIMDYKFPLPPLSEQERIVVILDKFDALVNDLSSGLPAEIAARRKQYEYYRDRLLTFTPAN